jgi:hypothetical protein
VCAIPDDVTSRRPAPGRSKVPIYKIVDESGEWQTDMRLSAPDRKPGDRIPRGRDFLEVIEVRPGVDRDVLVVRTGQGQNSD